MQLHLTADGERIYLLPEGLPEGTLELVTLLGRVRKVDAALAPLYDITGKLAAREESTLAEVMVAVERELSEVGPLLDAVHRNTVTDEQAIALADKFGFNPQELEGASDDKLDSHVRKVEERLSALGRHLGEVSGS
jgi:hypothetical protein